MGAGTASAFSMQLVHFYCHVSNHVKSAHGVRHGDGDIPTHTHLNKSAHVSRHLCPDPMHQRPTASARTDGSLHIFSWFANWSFEPSHPLGIMSGLKETFIKRYIVERTNKAEIRPEEQSQKMKKCREN